MKPVESVLEYLGTDLTSDQVGQLATFRTWLADEASTAGGIGPGEIQRLESRHLADSLLFAKALGEPDEVWDLGTGVGLPGIPLAIVNPSTHFVLIDRSGRRVTLARRAVRVLGLENCQVEQGDITSVEGQVPAVVSRASLPPDRLEPVARRLLMINGVAVAGGSWVRAPSFPGWTAIEIPVDVLGRPIWLLMMRHQ